MPQYADLLARLKAGTEVSPQEIAAVKADMATTPALREYVALLWDFRPYGPQPTAAPYHDIFARAKLGNGQSAEYRVQAGYVVSDDEVAAVAAELAHNPLGPDRYTLLYILALVGTPVYRAVVERFLTDRSSWTARLALRTLCSPWYWNLTAEYLPQIVGFLRRGLPPDEDESARSQAADLAGEYLAHTAAPVLLRALLDILGNPQESADMRECAGRAVAKAMGYSEEVIPRAPAITDLDRFAESAIVQQAQQRLMREENQVQPVS